MQDLLIERTKSIYFTPYIHFQAETGICEMAGESYLEDAPSFYQPLIDWIQMYFDKTDGLLSFNFKLTYFNTSSSKALLGLIKEIKKFDDYKRLKSINWYYPDDNYDLLAEAEDFMEDVQLIFNLIPYKLDY